MKPDTSASSTYYRSVKDITPYDYGALVLRLRANEATVETLQTKRGRIAAFMGSAVHQAFHAAISDAAAAALHDTAIAFQPFATSTLFRWQLDIPLMGRVAVGDMAWIRFVALHPYILRQLDDYRRTKPRAIEIVRVPWQVLSCDWHSHLYSSRCSAAERWQQRQLTPPPRFIRLRFLTPTYFKSKGIEPYLTPEPRLVFAEGLLERWKQFFPAQPPPPDFADFVQRHVCLHLRIGYTTATVMLKGAVVTGFTGDVVYRADLPETPGEWHHECAAFLALMAEFATFAGVGKKTTMGLGMIDRVRVIRSRPVSCFSDAKGCASPARRTTVIRDSLEG